MAAKKFSPISALLWKNFRINFKRPVAWVFLVIFPVLLSLLLFFLQYGAVNVVQPNCNIKAKALPSASGMLFLQTFLCAAGNICEDEKNASSESFSSSLLSNVGEALKGAFNIKPKRSKELDLNKLSEDFYAIDGLIEAIDKENKKWQLLYNSLLRSNIYLSASESENSYIQKLSRIKRNIHTTGVLNSFIRILTEDQASWKSLMNFLNKFFCGPNMEKIEDQLLKAVKDIAARKFKEEDDMSDYCNSMINFFEMTPYKLILQFLRPLLFGKVVYTPDAPVINRIMNRFSESFTKIKNLLDLLKVSNRAWAELRASKLDEITNKYKNEDFLREVVKTKAGRAALERFEDETTDDLEEKPFKRKIDIFKKLLNETGKNYTTYLQETVPENDISHLLSVLECIDFNKVIAMKSEGDALAKAHKFLEKDRLWAYIVFTNVPPGAEKLPTSVTYKMRIAANRSPNTKYKKDIVNKTLVVRDPIKALKEIQGGTVHLQNMIESELIREYTGRKNVPGIYLNQLPYPCFLSASWRQPTLKSLKTIIVFAFINFYSRVVKRIVVEKETLFKEILRVFGVSNAHHWIAFFIEAFFTGFVSVLIFSLVLKALLGYFAVIFLLLIVFMVSIIALAFLISTFLMKSSYCTMLACGVYFLLYLFDTLVSGTDSVVGRVVLCFISISAVTYGTTWIENMDTSNVPVSLAFLNYSPDPESPITMLLVIIMLLIDSVIYILLAIYFENIISTKAVRKPWNYCFKASYWKNCFKKNEPEVEISEPQTTARSAKKGDSKNFEAEPEEPVGIEVINVSKEFGKNKNKIRVVNDLSINFYENQITSFLGHNGAGKSTTVLMMTGVISPTKGTIRIYGIDLKKDPRSALSNVGICLQENVIIGELTVRDHLILIGRLKGLNKKEIKENIDQLLEDFEFTSRAGQPVKQLSGGWKRKVCIAMAFMGGSRTIFLDEPTAGIDPFARRTVWDILVKLKKGRTIVLITHHLDEADILGDRIAIIASGELKCCGSSLFLKSNLDKGYILTVDTQRSDKISPKKNRNGKKQLSPEAQELLNLVKSSIHGSEIEEQRGTEYVFSLPQKQSSTDLNRLFEALDRNKSKLKINSYGVSAVSLEEVFMKVLMKVEAEENDKKDVTDRGSISQKSNREESEGHKSTQDSNEVLVEDLRKTKESLEVPPKSPKPSTSAETKKMIALRQKEKFVARRKFWNHFSALWVKRIQNCRRNYIFLLFQIFLPAAYAFFGLLSTLLLSPELPSVQVDVSAYDSSILFYTNHIPANHHLSSYEKALLGPYGLGTKCILSPEKCSLKSIPMGSMVAKSQTIASNKCDCDKDGKLECKGNATAEPPQAEMSTGHKLFNMSGLDLNNWLIATEFKYSIKRIGGITFGYISPLTGVSVGDFLSLFSEKNLLNVLEKYITGGKEEIDPKQFTSDIMSGLNKSFGAQLFEDKDPADNIIIWFNSVNKIASMAMINGVSNLVLRASLPVGTDPSGYSIRLIVHPFPMTGFSTGSESLFQILLAVILTIIQSLAFLFAMLIIYLVDERSCGMKQLALISGINPLVYWCSYFMWDIVIFSLYFVLLLLEFFVLNITSFCGSNTLPVFTAALYSYALATLTFVYLMSHLFTLASSAIVFILIWLMIVGGLSFTFGALLKSTHSLDLLLKILLVIPENSLGNCLLNLAMQSSQGVALSADSTGYFEWDLTTQYIIRLLIVGGVYMVILVLVELRQVQPFGIVTKCCSSLKLLCRSSSVKEEEDDDVAAEKERVRSHKAKEEGDLLIMKNLTKIYCGQAHPAANHIYVGIKRGECLGLLGMNGAGKTTIFKMISGTAMPTSGDATIGGFSISYSPMKSRVLMGYCPQMNALDPYLTPVEHLLFFSRIRGYSKKKRNKETETLINLFGLSKHKDKISKTLSGGNQRKLNAAIALLSEPELILLDEPTAGMDVLARRFLWSRLLEVLQDGRCLILTTHSMEECQALATQVCIMFKGRFICFGSSQHLKYKFNEGYSVTMRLMNSEKYNDVIRYLNENLPGFTVISTHILYLKVRLHRDASIGKALTVMGELKKKQWIEDYSINQTTLESVFLKLIGETDREAAFKQPCCRC